MPISRSVRQTRTAISPRFATSTLVNTRRSYGVRYRIESVTDPSRPMVRYLTPGSPAGRAPPAPPGQGPPARGESPPSPRASAPGWRRSARRSQRDVAVLAAGRVGPFSGAGLERGDENRPRAPGGDHVVDVAALGCRER